MLEPPAAAWYRITGSVSRRERRMRLSRVWAGTTAAAAAVLLVAVLVGRSGRDGPVESAQAGLSATREAASAELTAHYQDYLAGVDEAIAEIELALTENPGNPRVRMAHIGVRAARVRAVDQLCSWGE